MAHFFDAGANAFAKALDNALTSGTYHRGTLFLARVKQGVRPAGRVLDYGCGPGRIAKLLGTQGFRVDAVDPSPAMLAEARKQDMTGLQVEFRHYEGNGDDLDANAYDGIVCSSVIEYVHEPERLLRNFNRALRKGGSLVLSYANKYSFVRAYSVLRYRRRMPHLSVQENVWGFREVRAALEAASFREISAPTFFEATPFDRRAPLHFLSGCRFIGTLGLVTARP